jgi:uncharacterized membrane protein
MKNHSFPSWSGPFVGMIAGVLLGLKAAPNAQGMLWWYILGGAVIGGLAGALVLLLDPRPPEDFPADLPAHLVPRRAARPSGVVGRFLALAGCLLCLAPALGLVLNIIGLAVNWKSDDWARKASIGGLVIGACVHILLLIVAILDL